MTEPVVQKDLFSKRWRKVPRNDPSELQLQISLIEHLRYRARPDVIYFHVPNGGLRNKREAAKFQAMGVLPGVADLVFVWSDDHRLQNMYLELKAHGRKQSPVQHNFSVAIEAAGAAYECCDDIDDALTILHRYGLLKR